MSSLEHKGTAFDASGGRVPPASHRRPKGVARALRARGIVRSRIQRVFVVPNRIALQKNPLCTPLKAEVDRLEKLTGKAAKPPAAGGGGDKKLTADEWLAEELKKDK